MMEQQKQTEKPSQSKDEAPRVVTCQGCESECEVAVAVIDGKPVCLGGNNCPTGESFALSAMK